MQQSPQEVWKERCGMGTVGPSVELQILCPPINTQIRPVALISGTGASVAMSVTDLAAQARVNRSSFYRLSALPGLIPDDERTLYGRSVSSSKNDVLVTLNQLAAYTRIALMTTEGSTAGCQSLGSSATRRS